MRALALGTLLALAPIAALSQDRAYPWEFRAEDAHEDLDRGRADWEEGLVQLAWRPRRGLALLGGARATDRFDQRDREGFAAAWLPLGSERTTLHVEGTASSTHRVLARWTALAELSHAFGEGWVGSAAAKLSRFSQADARTVSATVERYMGDFRLGYTAFLSRPESGSWSPAHRIAASWYRGDLTYVTVAGARGREVENVFPSGLLASDVRAASIGAGLELAPRWGLTLEWARVRQGDLYTRRTARIGTRLLF